MALLVIAYLPNKEFKELFNMGKNMLKGIFHRKKTVAVVESGEASEQVAKVDEKIEDSNKE